jgi:hypothetical protein
MHVGAPEQNRLLIHTSKNPQNLSRNGRCEAPSRSIVKNDIVALKVGFLERKLHLSASVVALLAAPVGFASVIVADCLAFFAEFRGKRFTLLWRGSRDGFGARDFHVRCDDHAPILAVGWGIRIRKQIRVP